MLVSTMLIRTGLILYVQISMCMEAFESTEVVIEAIGMLVKTNIQEVYTDVPRKESSSSKICYRRSRSDDCVSIARVCFETNTASREFVHGYCG